MLGVIFIVYQRFVRVLEERPVRPCLTIEGGQSDFRKLKFFIDFGRALEQCRGRLFYRGIKIGSGYTYSTDFNRLSSTVKKAVPTKNYI